MKTEQFPNFKDWYKLNEQDSGLDLPEFDQLNKKYNNNGSQEGKVVNNLYIALNSAVKSGIIDERQYTSTLDILNMEDISREDPNMDIPADNGSSDNIPKLR
jgi:hypothetical protein